MHVVRLPALSNHLHDSLFERHTPKQSCFSRPLAMANLQVRQRCQLIKHARGQVCQVVMVQPPLEEGEARTTRKQ